MQTGPTYVVLPLPPSSPSWLVILPRSATKPDSSELAFSANSFSFAVVVAFV